MSGQQITIIHFNDVYNLEPSKTEPQGGAARMASYIKSCQDLDPIVLFSGDILNPSLMSIFLKGLQMIPVINNFDVKCAVFGNHDFDFGVDHLMEFISKTKCPWLLSNVKDNLTKNSLAKGKIQHIIQTKGIKIGLIGLVEHEWIDTLATLDPEDVTFEDYIERGNELSKQLKQEGVDIVIALTHMRWPNDRRLAENVEDIDLILGGHDHDYNVEMVNGKYIVKSGSDFKNLSKIKITLAQNGIQVDVQQVDLDSNVTEDPDMQKIVSQSNEKINEKMDENLGYIGVEIDGRFSSIRSQETNLGNFVTDVMLEVSKADCALLNSGTFRSDRKHPRGDFKLRDLLTILPLVDPLVVIEVKGSDIITALENGVSKYPALEGRFPQVSGMSFGFDPTKPPGERVDAELVQIQDQYIKLNKNYRLCTKEYIADGKDGYDVFKNCEIIIDSEKMTTLSTAVRNHFESVQIVQGSKKCKSGHRQSLISLVKIFKQKKYGYFAILGSWAASNSGERKSGLLSIRQHLLEIEKREVMKMTKVEIPIISVSAEKILEEDEELDELEEENEIKQIEEDDFRDKERLNVIEKQKYIDIHTL